LKRREFITLLGGAAAWPLAARAQQPAIPVIGFLRSTPSDPSTKLVEALRRGLKEVGFVEGQSVVIEQRYADNHLDRLPGLAGDLVNRKVTVIIANSLAAEAARAATETIPIVFVTADDPVTRGLVTSLNRPAGNLTGLTFFGGGKLGAKRLELLHELVPKAMVIALLMDPNWPGAVAELPELEAAARAIGRQIVVVRASNEREFEDAFAKITQSGAGALMVAGSPFFTSQRRTLVALAARHAIPAIYDVRENVEAGGLISYSASFTDAYRQAGIYAGRILKGAKPSELPVLQPTTFELALNLKTAKALGLTIPSSIMVQADEVIE
jgi:putative tryptophan/tyrosine transport system substrate-binding protein